MNPGPHMLEFSGKTVLVIGGSSGIGAATAQSFRARGATVFVTGTRASAEDYAGLEGSELEGLGYAQLDATNQADLADWKPPFETLDVLVLSQGIVRYKRQEFDPAVFRSVIDVNLNSLMGCASRFHDALAKAKGALIIISSVGAYRVTRANPAYAASKAGAVHLTATLGDAWAGDGIRVNGIAPGLIETRLTQVTTRDPARLAQRLEGIPLKRLGSAEEIANIALFLASPMSSYIVGQTIIADGGRSLG